MNCTSRGLGPAEEGRKSRLIYAKEVLIASARRLGCSLTEIADALGVDPSTVTRCHEAAKRKMTHNEQMAVHLENVVSRYTSS